MTIRGISALDHIGTVGVIPLIHTIYSSSLDLPVWHLSSSGQANVIVLRTLEVD